MTGEHAEFQKNARSRQDTSPAPLRHSLPYEDWHDGALVQPSVAEMPYFTGFQVPWEQQIAPQDDRSISLAQEPQGGETEPSPQEGPEVDNFINAVNSIDWSNSSFFDSFKPSSFMGHFAVHYSPERGLLTITARVFFDFHAGGQGAGFEWDEDEKKAWRSAAVREVQAFWRRRYAFSNDLPALQGLPPVEVEIVVDDVEDRKTAHYAIDAIQVEYDGQKGTTTNPNPGNGLQPFQWDWRDSVNNPGHSGPGRADWYPASSDGLETMDRVPRSRSIDAFKENGVLPEVYQDILDAASDIPPFQFKELSVEAPEASEEQNKKLEALAAALNQEMVPSFELEVVAYCNGNELSAGTNENNIVVRELLLENLLEPRAESVKAILTEKGIGNVNFNRQKSRDLEGKKLEDSRVEIILGKAKFSQVVVIHEFGHIFGLRDEYPEGKRQNGDPVVQAPYLESVYGDKYKDTISTRVSPGESIMSGGEKFEPHHYSTFLEALVRITETAGYGNNVPPDKDAASHWNVGKASSSEPSDSQTPEAEV